MALQIQKTVKKRKRKRSFLPFLVLILLLVAILAFFYHFRLDQVVIVGSTRYSEEEMKAHLMVKKTDKLTLFMYLRYQFTETKELPFIEKIDITMADSHTIRAEVYEKLVTGCIEMMGGYLYFDKDGIVVESSKDKLSDVPLVTGLKFDKIILYEQLEIQKESMFDTILNLTKLIQKFNLSVATVHFNSDYEVTLLIDGNEVLLGKKDFYDLPLAALPSILESAKEAKYTFDMRYYENSESKIIAKPLN